MTDDSQGGLRGDPVAPSGHGDGTRDQMCKHCNELEAARDHLRARLQLQIEHWNERSAKLNWGAVHDDDLSDDEHERWFGEADALKTCAADLLAVLTEPQQQEKHEKLNEHAVSRSAETDVIREVALPQRED